MIPLFGQVLIRRQALTPEDLEAALAHQEQHAPDKRLGEILVDLGRVKEDDVSRALAEQWGLPYLEEIPAAAVSGDLLQHVPMEFLRKHGILPFRTEQGGPGLAVADPLDLMAIDAVLNALEPPCARMLAPRAAIESGLSQYYYHDGDAAETELEGQGRLSSSSPETYTEDLLDLSQGAPIIKLVNAFLFQASQSRASDIHVEPYEDDVKVRFRIDGVLYTHSTLSKQYYAAVASRLKIMAKLNIAERRLPQDGRSRIKIGDREIDTRVSTIPTAWGERVVLRLLDEAGGGSFGLEQLGFEPDTEKQFRRLISRPHGIILLTGPTGSGKTTTLYGAISELNRDDQNIMTVEDPIEYRLAGVSQTQVMPKIGLTFAACLRHILRQDPDIIMIGEIRDLETARIAIQAALTGHLVLSTLHTNDAASAVTRLTDMGIEPYLVSSSLLGIMAQRLVRRVCPDCRHLAQATPCPTCGGTGYRGRMGIFELLVLDDELRELVLADARAQALKQAALKKGMCTLRDDGLRKTARGLTTTEEVFRVTQDDSDVMDDPPEAKEPDGTV